MLGHKPSFKHYLRVAVTYLLLAVAVGGGTYFVVQLARGYQLNLNQQQLELTGLIRVESNPDANVIIDGENSGEQTPARLSLVEGERQITLEQTGFQRWSRSLNVTGGSVRALTYPFLIPFDVEAGTKPALELGDSDSYAFDKNGSVLAVSTGSQINIYQLFEDEFTDAYRQIELDAGVEASNFIWAESSEQLLFQTTGDNSRWLVADISEPEPEVSDITQEVGDLTPVGFVVDAGQKVVLSGGEELWLLSLEDRSQQLLTRQADAFAFNNSAVVWHDRTESESLQVWNQNQAESIPVLSDVTGQVKLAVSSYSNQTNVAYTQSGTTRVIADALVAPFERELDQFQSVSDISPGGRFVLGRTDDQRYVVHDIEQNISHTFELVDDLSTLKWSGTHHFIARGDNGVYVADYDGSNQRRINFEPASAGVLNAQKTAVFSVVEDQLLLTPLGR